MPFETDSHELVLRRKSSRSRLFLLLFVFLLYLGTHAIRFVQDMVNDWNDFLYFLNIDRLSPYERWHCTSSVGKPNI